MHGAVHPEVRSRAMARKKTAKRPAKKRPAPRHPVRLQPESLRLRSLAVSLTVNDLAKSIAWYRDVLRFTVGERWEDSGQLLGVQLKAGSGRLDYAPQDMPWGDRAFAITDPDGFKLTVVQE